MLIAMHPKANGYQMEEQRRLGTERPVVVEDLYGYSIQVKRGSNTLIT